MTDHEILLLSDGAFRMLHHMRWFCESAGKTRMRCELLGCLNRTGRWTMRAMHSYMRELIDVGFVVQEDGFYIMNEADCDSVESELESYSRAEHQREQARLRKQRQRDKVKDVTDVTRDTSVTSERDMSRAHEKNSYNLLNNNFKLKQEKENYPAREERDLSVTSERDTRVTKKEKHPDEPIRRLIVSEFMKREQERKPDVVIVLTRYPALVARCARWCADMGERHSMDSRAVLDRILSNYFNSDAYWHKNPFYAFLNGYVNLWELPERKTYTPKTSGYTPPKLPTLEEYEAEARRLAMENGEVYA